MDEPFSLRKEALPTAVRKGEKTREAILADALALASQIGLEALSFGDVAQRSGLSKSGLFAHFGSKDELQRAVLHRAQTLFRERVLAPAQEHPAGLARLRAFFDFWLAWIDECGEMPGGCLLLSAASEYDDRPGELHDALAQGHRELRGALAKVVRTAIEAGELAPNSDPWQLTFDVLGLVLAAWHERRLLDDRRAMERARRSFDRALASYLTVPAH